MKILFLLLALISNFIFACPDLSGTYSRCTSKSGDNSDTVDVVISQKKENGMMIYTVKAKDSQSGEEETTVMIADGKTRIMEDKDPETGIVFIQNETYFCKENMLLGSMSLNIDGQLMLNIKMNSKKSGTVMTSEISGSSMGAPINDLVTCK